MTGFDLPPAVGYDRMFRQQQRLAEDAIPAPARKALEALQQDPAAGAAAEAKRTPFESALVRSLDTVRELQADVKSKYEGMVLGEDVELHDIMAAANKSEVAFNLMIEVRNKLVEAWEKLSRSAV
jgi:flagellar hook-basal body complex protein FliE